MYIIIVGRVDHLQARNTAIRIGHGEVFLTESKLRIFSKCLEDISGGVYCYLT